MSDIKSQQNTVLLMEGVDPRIQLNSPLLPPIYYVYDPPPPNPPPLKPVYLRPNLDMDPDKTNLTFNWDWKNLSVASPPRPTLPTTVGVLRKSPHPGGVVMAFCDGRVEFINDEAEVNATTFSYGPDWVP